MSGKKRVLKTRKAGDAKSTSELNLPNIPSAQAAENAIPVLLEAASSATAMTPIVAEAEVSSAPKEIDMTAIGTFAQVEVIMPPKRERKRAIVSEALQEKLNSGGANQIADRALKIALDGDRESDQLAAIQFITEATEGKKTVQEHTVSQESIDLLSAIAARLERIPR